MIGYDGSSDIDGVSSMPSCFEGHCMSGQRTRECSDSHDHRRFPRQYDAWRVANLTEPRARVDTVVMLDKVMSSNAECLLADLWKRLKCSGTGVDAGAKSDNPMQPSQMEEKLSPQTHSRNWSCSAHLTMRSFACAAPTVSALSQLET